MLGHSQILNKNLFNFFKKGLINSPFLCSNYFMKNEIRIYAKNLRQTLNIQDLSKKIQKNLFSLEEYKKALNIMTYYSFGDEARTVEFFNDKTKNWFIPKIEKTDLKICPYDEEKLCKNKYNIFESTLKPLEDISLIDMIIIPCLAADKNGYRIGYGKGFYDRFLSKLKHNPVKIALVFSPLLYDSIFPEKYDISCDIIITDKEIYRKIVKK